MKLVTTPDAAVQSGGPGHGAATAAQYAGAATNGTERATPGAADRGPLQTAAAARLAPAAPGAGNEVAANPMALAAQSETTVTPAANGTNVALAMAPGAPSISPAGTTSGAAASAPDTGASVTPGAAASRGMATAANGPSAPASGGNSLPPGAAAATALRPPAGTAMQGSANAGGGASSGANNPPPHGGAGSGADANGGQHGGNSQPEAASPRTAAAFLKSAAATANVAAAAKSRGDSAAPAAARSSAAGATASDGPSTTAPMAAAAPANAGGAAVTGSNAAVPSGNLASQLTAAAAPPPELAPAGNSRQLKIEIQNDALGAVAVRATMRPAGLEAAIQAARAETQTVLRQDLPLLQQALSAHNIRVGSLTVASAPANHGSAGNSNNSGGGSGGNTGNSAGGQNTLGSNAQDGGRQSRQQPGETQTVHRALAAADEPHAGGVLRDVHPAAATAPGRLSVRV